MFNLKSTHSKLGKAPSKNETAKEHKISTLSSVTVLTGVLLLSIQSVSAHHRANHQQGNGNAQGVGNGVVNSAANANSNGITNGFSNGNGQGLGNGGLAVPTTPAPAPEMDLIPDPVLCVSPEIEGLRFEAFWAQVRNSESVITDEPGLCQVSNTASTTFGSPLPPTSFVSASATFPGTGFAPNNQFSSSIWIVIDGGRAGSNQNSLDEITQASCALMLGCQNYQNAQ